MMCVRHGWWLAIIDLPSSSFQTLQLFSYFVSTVSETILCVSTLNILYCHGSFSPGFWLSSFISIVMAWALNCFITLKEIDGTNNVVLLLIALLSLKYYSNIMGKLLLLRQICYHIIFSSGFEKKEVISVKIVFLWNLMRIVNFQFRVIQLF